MRSRTCPTCKFEYLPELSDNQRQHHAFHADYQRGRKPKPNPKLLDFPAGDIRVDVQSPRWLSRLVYDYARALKRDEHFDFTPWPEHPSELGDSKGQSDWHAWLIRIESQLVVGAASFAKVHYSNIGTQAELAWIWIAEPWRRKGLLTERWLTWCNTYGEFLIQKPWTEAMEKFLLKVGLPNRIQRFHRGDAQ